MTRQISEGILFESWHILSRVAAVDLVGRVIGRLRNWRSGVMAFDSVVKDTMHRWRRGEIFLVAAFFLGALALSAMVDGNELLLQAKRWEAEIRSLYRSSPVVVVGIIFAGYVVLTSLPLPGALVATLLTGWICGLPTGVVVVSFASTTAACMTWLLGRTIVSRVSPGRLEPLFETLKSVSSREAAAYLLALRLVPGVPFFLVNSGMSLTSIRLRQFWVVSQIGMLPATILYVYIGSSIPDLEQLAAQRVSGIVSVKILICLILLRFLPIMIHQIIRRRWK